MTNVLVTGGAGFIGSHIVRALLERGDRVRVLDNFVTGRRENLSGLHGPLEVLEGDLRDPGKVREAVQGVELAFHQAAFVSMPQSMQDPETCTAVNVGGTLSLLEAARKAGVRKVVLASSTAVYGNPTAFPTAETSPLEPLSPYAVSKQVGELYARLYTRAFGLPVVALRYFNVNGPRQQPDSPYAAAIPIFMRRMLAGEPITIYGDGRQSRDFIFVADVVRANLLSAEADNAAGEAINVCTGTEISILDLLETISELVPHPSPVNFAPPRPGDVFRSLGDPGKAARLLGFHAGTTLADGLKQTIEWIHP
jgi:nucleoside-diphosphate-sugar epimerase